MRIKINKRLSAFNILFFICLLYILMRPVLTEYFGDVFKYIFFLCVLYCVIKGLLRRNIRQSMRNTDILLYCIFILYVVISSIVVGGLPLFRITAERYVFYMFPIIAMPVVARKIAWKNFLNFLIIFGVVDATVSIIEFITHTQMFPVTGQSSMVVQYNGSIRTYGLNGNYFILAEILCVCGLAAFFKYLMKKDKKALVFFVYISIGLLTTGTRGFYLSYFIGIVSMYLMGLQIKMTKELLIRLLGTIVVVLVLVYIIFFSDIQIGIRGVDAVLIRFRTIFDTTENANSVRLLVWNKAIAEWKVRPLLGNGASITDPNYIYSLGVTESGFLKRLVELGVVGTVLQYSTMFVPFFRGIKKYKKAKNKNYYCVFFINIVISFIIEDMVLQMYTGIEYTVLIWSAISLVSFFYDDYIIED